VLGQGCKRQRKTSLSGIVTAWVKFFVDKNGMRSIFVATPGEETAKVGDGR